MNTPLPIAVCQGMIEVEASSGVFGEDHFLLYLTLREKHAEAEVVCTNPAILTLRANANTLRAAPDGDSYEKIDLKGKSTVVTLPCGWSVEASVSRYTCVVVGVRTPAPEQLSNVPFTIVANDDEAYRVVVQSA